MNQYLNHALDTAKFLQANQLETTHGIAWARVPGGKPNHTLYHGSAGVILFQVELYQATGDKHYLDTAIAAGNELLAYVADKAGAEQFVTVGFYSGWPGYVYTLNELFRLTGQQQFITGAKQALDRLSAQSAALGDGIGWIEPIPFSDITGITGEREVIDLSVGAAGAGIIYLYAHRNGLGEDALDFAVKTADRLLQVAEQTPQGLRWSMMVDMPFPFTAPNFAHGGSGVGYFLADLYRETGNQAYLDAAIQAAAYTMSRAVPQDDGCLICHIEEQQPPTTFYLGVCHGPAGTGRLIYLLNRITGETSYLDWLTSNFNGLRSTGAPEQRSKGLWQNFGQCCGDAGIGDYALFLYQQTADPEYLAFARRIADNLVAHANNKEGMSWVQAEHRDRPKFIEEQTGYMQGAAGIGSFLLHLATLLDGKPVKLVLPETPFGY